MGCQSSKSRSRLPLPPPPPPPPSPHNGGAAPPPPPPPPPPFGSLWRWWQLPTRCHAPQQHDVGTAMKPTNLTEFFFRPLSLFFVSVARRIISEIELPETRTDRHNTPLYIHSMQLIWEIELPETRTDRHNTPLYIHSMQLLQITPCNL